MRIAGWTRRSSGSWWRPGGPATTRPARCRCCWSAPQRRRPRRPVARPPRPGIPARPPPPPLRRAFWLRQRRGHPLGDPTAPRGRQAVGGGRLLQRRRLGGRRRAAPPGRIRPSGCLQRRRRPRPDHRQVSRDRRAPLSGRRHAGEGLSAGHPPVGQASAARRLDCRYHQWVGGHDHLWWEQQFPRPSGGSSPGVS